MAKIGGGQATRNSSAPDAKLRALGFPTGAPKGLLAPGTRPPADLKLPGPGAPDSGQTKRPGRQSGNAGNEPTS